jgi:SpoVK/Ycf46/Vps4 family AAA+-type ATPase
MFLRELINVLSRHIQQRLLKQYEAKSYDEEMNGLSQLVDINVHIDGSELSLRETLLTELVSTFSSFSGDKSELLLKTPAKKKKALSALLFGPPGTSKTEIAKGLAANLQWPLVEIDPSKFLQNTFQNIYVQAETIFKDVMDMYGVVVLFDELDALVQKRDGTDAPDTESKFLTTYMLPKLAKLHDQRRLVFLMATNFQEKFDDAIKRAGRFDFLLCLGPPSLDAKCSSLHVFLGRENVTEENREKIEACGALLLQHAQSDPWVRDQLALYTFLEFRSFVSKLGDVNSIADRVASLKPESIRKLVEVDSQSVGLRLRDLDDLNKLDEKLCAWKPAPWKDLQDLYTAEFDEDKLKDSKGRLTPTVKYVIERKQSKRQV